MHHFTMTPRRRLAQICFFLSGLSLIAFFGGVELWARQIMLLLLGLACLLEGSSPCGWRAPMSKGIRMAGGALMGLGLLEVCPWPSAWAAWLAPGQARLLRELEYYRVASLHGSMDPSATWQSLAMLLAFGSATYLAWFWSLDHQFRRRLRRFILLLGGLTALLGVLDYWCHSERIYGLRATEFASHWGPFINRNHYANYLVVCGVFSLGMFFHCALPVERPQRNLRYGMVALGVGVLCLGGAVMTASRGAMVGLAVGLLAFTLLLGYRARSTVRVRVMVVVVLVGAALVLTYGRGLLQRVEAAVKETSPISQEGRLKVWRDAWKMSLDMRGRGIGPGAFETVFPAFQSGFGQNTFTHVENEYLQVWVEWGVLGSIGWAALLVLIVRRAWHTTTTYQREWQMGGWAALVAMAVHAGMDFPLHIPANAWLASVLLGMCLHDPAEVPAPPPADAEMDRPRPGYHPELLALGVLVLGSMLAVWAGSRNRFGEIERELARGNFRQAWQASQTAMQRWPFYWRSYSLGGAAAAGLPSMSREVDRLYRTAQRLAQCNLEISWQAGVLFLNRSPSISRDFFETALSISEAPYVEMERLLALIGQRGSDFLLIAPIGLRNADRWERLYEYLVSHRAPKATIDQWVEEGRQRWLTDPVQRVKVIGLLVERGQTAGVLESFRRSPPKRPREEYWYARALETAGLCEPAAQAYRKLWQECVPRAPLFRATIDVTEQTLRRAAMKVDDLKFQGLVAESLAAQSRHAEAAKLWARVLAQEPNNQLAWYGYALGMQEADDWKKTASVWRRLVERYPQVTR